MRVGNEGYEPDDAVCRSNYKREWNSSEDPIFTEIIPHLNNRRHLGNPKVYKKSQKQDRGPQPLNPTKYPTQKTQQPISQVELLLFAQLIMRQQFDYSCKGHLRRFERREKDLEEAELSRWGSGGSAILQRLRPE